MIRRWLVLSAISLATAVHLTAQAAAWPEAVRAVEFVSPADGTTQAAMFAAPPSDAPLPLVVVLHTWSGDHRQTAPGAACARWCLEHGVAFVQPDCRGPNRRPEACGSVLVVQDVLGAVAFAKANAAIDPRRVYLYGESGGGHLALLLAGRFPELWAGVSAWVPITDLARWHAECAAAGRRYAADVVACCGGEPGASAVVDREYALRSPLTWLAHADGVPIDINTGIRDGHEGSVPVGHAIRAFDRLAAPDDRLGEDVIATLERTRAVPDTLRFAGDDPRYGEKRPLLRRTSHAVRLTVFDGGHEGIVPAGLSWLVEHVRR